MYIKQDIQLYLELEHMLSHMQDLGKEVAVSSLRICIVLGRKLLYCIVVEIQHHTAFTVKMSVLSVKWVSLILKYLDIPFIPSLV